MEKNKETAESTVAPSGELTVEHISKEANNEDSRKEEVASGTVDEEFEADKLEEEAQDFMLTALIMLQKDEGFRSKMYQCTARKWTIGYGRNLSDGGINEAEALFMLRNDVIDCIAACTSVFPAFASFSKPRRLAFINLMLNIGKTRFVSFQRMIKAASDENWVLAAAELMDSRYSKQVTNRAIRLRDLILHVGWIEKGEQWLAENTDQLFPKNEA